MESGDHLGPVSTADIETPLLYRRVADDPNAQANNLLGWSQIYDQLSGGSFSGELRGACLRTVHVFRESTNLSLRQSCEVRSRGWWFGIPATEEGSFRVDLRRVERGSVAVRRGHQPFELITPQNFHIYGIVVEHERLRRYLNATYPEHRSLLARGLDTIPMSVQMGGMLRHLIRKVLQEIASRPAVLDSANAREAIESNLVEAVAELCVTPERALCVTRREVQSSLIVRNVRQYVLDHSNRVIAVPELCKAFDVSRRTLQYAFEQVLGISPNAYLRILRLNGARRDLAGREAQISVQQAAADWGFWHLSQFAKDYRALFDELPSATLRRAGGCGD
ncbi:helix-turn-helix domain-containing protein [Edaphobacter sp. HDX4]|uniref:helix-turn-helix domain-containing protein n=1 Tax=Edaphobacter sp. HDX4 TaxID=2794064 RepID=UPI002FE5090D